MDNIDYKNRMEEANRIFEEYLNQLTKIHSNFLKGLSEIRKEDDMKKVAELRK